MLCLGSTLIAALVVGEPASARSEPFRYPIPPRPLRLLVKEAPFIVTARVEAVDPENARGFMVETVRLEVLECLKNDPATQTIVQTIHQPICPAPPRYRPGTSALVLLRRDDEGRFFTYALSYGAKSLSEAHLDVYVERVREQLAIDRIENDSEKRIAQVEWLVRCAENPATRWEGAYELWPEGDRTEDTDQYHENYGRPEFHRSHSTEQRIRLVDALIAARSAKEADRCVEQLLLADVDSGMIAPLVERLRAARKLAEVAGPDEDGVEIDRFRTDRRLLVALIANRDSRAEVQELREAYARRCEQPVAEGEWATYRLELARILGSEVGDVSRTADFTCPFGTFVIVEPHMPWVAPLLLAAWTSPWPYSAEPICRYPIPPRPLRMLVHEADYVVTARVREPGAEDRRSSGAPVSTRERIGSATFPGGVAPETVVLEIDTVLKGELATRSVTQTNHTMICPAPARYVVGTRVLAFLDAEPKGGYSTHALSYGAKTLADEALAVYVKRVEEQLEIEKLPKDEAQLVAQVEWLVRCAEDPLTRWEGAYELSRSGDFMSHYEDENRDIPDFGRHLSESQRTRVRESLLASVEFDSGEQCLEELFRADRDPRLLAWLVARLRECHAEVEHDSYGTAAFLIERLVRRDGRAEVRALAKEFETHQDLLTGTESNGRARLKVVREILELYAFPQASESEVKEPR